MKFKTRSLVARTLAVVVTTTMLAGAAPAMASALRETSGDPIRSKFTASLAPLPAPVAKLGRVLVEAPAYTESQQASTSNAAPVTTAANVSVASAPTVDDPVGETAMESPLARAQAALPVEVSVPDKPRSTDSVSDPAVRSNPSSGDELAQARAILSGLIAQYPILAGTTVSIGATPGGYQAVAYYQSGRIIISPNHTASLSTILNHEVWHIIDWRDNGRIDWGENIPPR